ncbi:flagellar assembly protein FliW [Demequina litorisediminis]|uniref:flagellar assembly protein FliW n=1 Tax=Demequina litorisediminis TaxID=1849022 RepID=UPI0024E157F4|nr:flagellar assembly protein FliW [Demequina litorisediminis]
MSDEQRESIGVEDLADALVLTVVTRTAQGEFSANLLAPIVVNLRSGAAVQAVLDEDWPLRAPLGSQPSA